MNNAARYRLVLVIVVLLFGTALALAPLEDLHGHDRPAPCAICQLAHLPALQPAITVVSAVLEPVAIDTGAHARLAVSEDTEESAIPRAPPFLHTI